MSINKSDEQSIYRYLILDFTFPLKEEILKNDSGQSLCFDTYKSASLYIDSYAGCNAWLVIRIEKN